MIEKKKSTQLYYKKSEILKSIGKTDPTADDVLTFLLGDSDGSISDYVLYRYDTQHTTLLQRINALWVYPLFIITIPYQWLVYGSIGVSRNSKIGKILSKLINFDG